MFEEAALKIEVRSAGKVVVMDVQSDRALIGSGAHCDVRLAPDEAAIEQLRVEAIDEEVHVKNLAVHRPCRLNGAPFMEGRLPAGAMLELGSVFVGVQYVQREVKEQKRERTSSTHPAVQALALIGLAVGFYYKVGALRGGGSAFEQQRVEPPVLAIADQPCPQTEPQAAEALASEALFEAEAKRERAPFYARDGIAAVQLFFRAGRCYERAGDQRAAAEARGEGEQLQRRLADELHVRHVRLERLLTEQKFGEVKRESAMIAEYVADPAHPYSQWLSAVAREGELQAKQGGRQ